MKVEVVGAGVAGLCCAVQLARQGIETKLVSASHGIDDSCCSWWAGGMLAPYCEMESAEPLIAELGHQSVEFWKHEFDSEHPAGLTCNGSMVVATTRDLPDLQQFAERTEQWQALEQAAITTLEPDLGEHFDRALFYPQEAHLDPRVALQHLLSVLEDEQVELRAKTKLDTESLDDVGDVDWRIDCRGLSARDRLTDLRGVKGEMLLLHSADVSLSRPIRLLHPRYPLYIVPRADQMFMVGATMLENEDRDRASARSIMELLSAAFTVHPAFAEAAIVEIGVDARPAFIDNLPRLRRRGKTLYVNGLFRHGFLCGPALANKAVDFIVNGTVDSKVMDENQA